MRDETSYSLAKKSGMAESLIRKYMTGESLPGMDKLVLLADLLKVRIEWLATGRGAKKSGEYPVGEPVGNFVIAEKEVLADGQFVLLPWFGGSVASARRTLSGQGQVLNPLAFRSSWILSGLRADPASLCLFAVEGDSMEPTLRQGDIVLVDRSAVLRDGIFLIRMGDAALLKRVQYMIDGTIKVESDNQIYEKEFFAPDQLEGLDMEIVGRIIWAGKKM